VNIDDFAMRLWGNIYFDQKRGNFSRKAADVESKRTFVHFILEPLYKLYTQVSGMDTGLSGLC
jgi:U5 small nuclear ribonucleoprotein component